MSKAKSAEKVVARHPAEDAAPVLSRRKDPDRSRGAARRREHSDALSPRGPEPESLLPVEQGVPRSREENGLLGIRPAKRRRVKSPTCAQENGRLKQVVAEMVLEKSDC